MPVKLLVDLINKQSFFGKKVRKFSVWLMELSGRRKIELFDKYLVGDTVLDVGLGTGQIARLLTREKYIVTGIDVTNTSLYKHIQPLIYDGVKIPLKSNSHDTGLLICVLHHCSKQLVVLEEAMRVCKRIIIIEDTYRNTLEKLLISVRDSVGNFEFYQHEYHTTKKWLAIFRSRGWRSVYTKEWSSLSIYGMYGRQTLFVIEPRVK